MERATFVIALFCGNTPHCVLSYKQISIAYFLEELSLLVFITLFYLAVDSSLTIKITMAIPQTTQSWSIGPENSFDALKFDKAAKLREVGANDVLVKLYAASLNFRDLVIPLVR